MSLQNLMSATLPVSGIIGRTQKFGQPLDTPTLPFLQNFEWSFIRIGPVNVHAKFEVRIALPIPEIMGYPKNWAVPGYANAPFSPNF